MRYQGAVRASGVTLVELLIVMAIVAVLAGLTLGRIDRSSVQLSEATSVLAGDLQRARTEAIRLNTPVRLVVDTAVGAYVAEVDVGCDGSVTSADLDLDGDGADDLTSATVFQRDLSASYGRAEIASTTMANDRLWFDARGLPRTVGCGNLSNPVSIRMRSVSGSPVTRTVRVELQGSVEVIRE